jgi:hypothetical protein
VESKVIRSAALVVVFTSLAVSSAFAALDVNFGATVRLGDRTDVYVAVSSRYFQQDRDVVRDLGVRYRNPDDLAVVLFLARHSGEPPVRIHAMRARGLSWWEISVRLGVPADAWFVEMHRDPGPPYGNAWGHWKKHRRDRRVAFSMTDDDCRNWVALRMMHEYYGVPVATAIEWRSSREGLDVVVSREYQRRHDPGRKSGASSSGHGHDRPGHGKGHGKKK